MNIEKLLCISQYSVHRAYQYGQILSLLTKERKVYNHIHMGSIYYLSIQHKIYFIRAIQLNTIIVE